jgi:DNA-directed RNA polymerase sigma subunit (sigma70/sigma32)
MNKTSVAELPKDKRMEIFAALVDAQDHDMRVAESIRHVGKQFGITESQVKQIEQEGIDAEWPPL